MRRTQPPKQIGKKKKHSNLPIYLEGGALGTGFTIPATKYMRHRTDEFVLRKAGQEKFGTNTKFRRRLAQLFAEHSPIRGRVLKHIYQNNRKPKRLKYAMTALPIAIGAGVTAAYIKARKHRENK